MAVAILLAYGILALGIHQRGVDAILELADRYGRRCPVLEFTGLKCGFCGMTRAFIHLFGGGIRAALGLNLFSIPVFVGVPAVAIVWACRPSQAFRLPPLVPVSLLTLLLLYAGVRNLVPGVP